MVNGGVGGRVAGIGRGEDGARPDERGMEREMRGKGLFGGLGGMGRGERGGSMVGLNPTLRLTFSL